MSDNALLRLAKLIEASDCGKLWVFFRWKPGMLFLPGQTYMNAALNFTIEKISIQEYESIFRKLINNPDSLRVIDMQLIKLKDTANPPY